MGKINLSKYEGRRFHSIKGRGVQIFRVNTVYSVMFLRRHTNFKRR